MINREIIRLKIVQLTYAYYQNGNKNIDTAEKELFFSLSKAYDLYQHLLSLIVAVDKEALRHLEVEQARAKREGTEEPSTKFVDNRFVLQLQANKVLSDFISTQKRTWDDEPKFISKLYEQITNSQIYKDYMESGDSSYEEDRELWRKLYRTLIQDNEEIDTLIEDQSLYWNGDKEIVDTFVLKTIKFFDEKNGSKQPLLAEYRDEEDREFASMLFRRAILNGDEYRRLISSGTKNWELKRIALIDTLIMQLALTEILTFPNIPVNVSLNEYVDIAKAYSTPKSGAFINGTLDGIVKQLREEKKLLKE